MNRVTLAVIFALLPLGSRALAGEVPLSSLDLSVAEQGWGRPGMNRSVDGHPLTIAGHAYPSGFGTHAPGRLAVQLDGGAGRFRAIVGIDDEVPPRAGSAAFSVAGDGRVLWHSGVLHQGDAAVPVDVDLAGIHHLQLRVDVAGDTFDHDHADWANATFSVTGTNPTTVAYQPAEVAIAPPSMADARPPIATAAVAAMPPLGWNSYDGYGDSVTEAEMRANLAAFAEHLRAHGYQYVVVDYRWYDPGAHDNNPNGRAGAALTMDGNGRLMPSPNRFPSAAGRVGFKALADDVHEMGLKFGIHVMRGIPRLAVKANLPIDGSPFHAADAAEPADTCGWCPDMFGVRGNTPAGRAWYASILRQYAAWGVDFIKVDDLSEPYHGNEVSAIRAAIDACGRPICFSTSPGPAPVGRAVHLMRNANLWRTTGDFWDDWKPLHAALDVADRWDGAVGPGHWPDLDMLPLGRLSVDGRSVGHDRQTRFTRAEQVTMLTLWAAFPSPLMIGGDLTSADEWEWSLLANDEVLAVNRDAGARPAERVANRGGRQAWRRELADGSVVVTLFNTTDVGDVPVSASWGELDLDGRYAVRDLWHRADLSVATDHVEVELPAHGAALLRLTAAK